MIRFTKRQLTLILKSGSFSKVDIVDREFCSMVAL